MSDDDDDIEDAKGANQESIRDQEGHSVDEIEVSQEKEGRQEEEELAGESRAVEHDGKSCAGGGACVGHDERQVTMVREREAITVRVRDEDRRKNAVW